MARFSQQFKVQSVDKALNRGAYQTIEDVSLKLGVGFSTLQTWIRLAKNNQLEKPNKIMSKEKSPHDWTNAERLDAILECHGLSDEQASKFCRERGVYLHHIKKWKRDIQSKKNGVVLDSNKVKKKLEKENKILKKELNRKEKALAETAALLVLSKKLEAMWPGDQEK